MARSKQPKNFYWCDSDYFDLIKFPIFTEKYDNLRERGQYAFAVNTRLTKLEIKLIIQELFCVKVKSVNTSFQYRLKAPTGATKAKWKKAIVTLVPGDSIDLVKVS